MEVFKYHAFVTRTYILPYHSYRVRFTFLDKDTKRNE